LDVPIEEYLTHIGFIPKGSQLGRKTFPGRPEWRSRSLHWTPPEGDSDSPAMGLATNLLELDEILADPRQWAVGKINAEPLYLRCPAKLHSLLERRIKVDDCTWVYTLKPETNTVEILRTAPAKKVPKDIEGVIGLGTAQWCEKLMTYASVFDTSDDGKISVRVPEILQNDSWGLDVQRGRIEDYLVYRGFITAGGVLTFEESSSRYILKLIWKPA
jgi:hypothetical protein